MNATLVGFVAILVWGISLPAVRMFEERIGILAYLTIAYMVASMLGIGWIIATRRRFPDRKAFSNPMLYGRWLFYLLHNASIFCAITLIKKENTPFVILINYLWPTAVILCSILFAGTRITRWWSFALGSAIIVASLSIEIIGPHGLMSSSLENTTDLIACMLAFIGAIAWGFYSALSRRFGDATGGSSILPFFQMSLTLSSLSLSPAIGGMAKWDHVTGGLLVLLVIYGALQFLAFQCWDIGMRRGNIVIVSLAADFTPWISLLTFSVLFKTAIESRTVLAAVLLVCGAMVTRYGTLPKREAAVPKALRALEKEGAA